MHTLHDITVAVTSFLRPGYLTRCLRDLQNHLPECKVIVCDDSHTPPDTNGVELISLPFDSGLSMKRNAIVQACKTPLLLMYSDDFATTKETREGVLKMLAVLNDNPQIDVASGRFNGIQYEGFIDIDDGVFREDLLRPGSEPWYKVDLTVNYFLARLSSIADLPWDDRMKIGGEHGDWFWRAKLAGKFVAWVAGANVNEQPFDLAGKHETYAAFRDRAKEGTALFMEKWGVRAFKPFVNTVNYRRHFTPKLQVGARVTPAPAVVIAIVTCVKYKARVQAQAETWIPLVQAAGYKVEIFDGPRLGVMDDYASLPEKTRALCRWAKAAGVQHLLKIDDDGYIHIENFKPVTDVEYAGMTQGPWDSGCFHLGIPDAPPGTYPHIYGSGGAYWLGRRAIEIIADAPKATDWAEDRWVGHTLKANGIDLTILEGYEIVTPPLGMNWLKPEVKILTQLSSPEDIRRSHVVLHDKLPLPPLKTKPGFVHPHYRIGVKK